MNVETRKRELIEKVDRLRPFLTLEYEMGNDLLIGLDDTVWEYYCEMLKEGCPTAFAEAVVKFFQKKVPESNRLSDRAAKALVIAFAEFFEEFLPEALPLPPVESALARRFRVIDAAMEPLFKDSQEERQEIQTQLTALLVRGEM
jgi:hypothetical protein